MNVALIHAQEAVVAGVLAFQVIREECCWHVKKHEWDVVRQLQASPWRNDTLQACVEPIQKPC